ncbi:glucose PTS transporter transcription antiterminator GlcT [Oceanobacillus oncorhynchi]|uniref:glucose PTS transporter transcription antiterminator GlcT n=1 Tax=Oceanobacillus oncorhynchi TaxID=545501 RepID=UPI001865BED3|nr:transcription antiterminator [Oceanobacillus oncorhynchi]MDM8098833.1 transcription antiterminator [Oceanobacillus oncorhynchi]
MDAFSVIKSLNNNVLIAEDTNQNEVILIGKGIGFAKKKRDLIESKTVEKLFVLRDREEQENYKKIIDNIDEKTLQSIVDSIEIIKKRINTFTDEHTLVALTDHIIFALARLQQGLEIRNPFLAETKVLYPFEYEIASEIVEYMNQFLPVHLPEGEIGFVALHVHSAMEGTALNEINRYSQLVSNLIKIIEDQLYITLDRDSMDYVRFVRHLRYTIERVLNGDKVEEPRKMADLLKEEYPVFYNLSWKLIKIMQQTLKKPVFDAESVYLTIHLQRLHENIQLKSKTN